MLLCGDGSDKGRPWKYDDLELWSTSLIVHLREEAHNDLYCELVLCLETLAFKLSPCVRLLCVFTHD